MFHITTLSQNFIDDPSQHSNENCTNVRIIIYSLRKENQKLEYS